MPRLRFPLRGTALFALIMLALAWRFALATCPNPSSGPDISVGDLFNASSNYGQVGDIRAYSFSFNPCNVGNQALNVNGSTNQHPVVAQNLYRLAIVNGAARIEHIGQAWVYHEFASINQSVCCACSAPSPPSSILLYAGCTNSNASAQTGSATNLGPRSEVNAFTGAFPYPFGGSPAPPTIGRRLQVHVGDIDPALNRGALYFAEAIYVAADDAAAGNRNNNGSY